MAARSALAALAGLLALAAGQAPAEVLLSGTIGAASPCQPWRGGYQEATILIVEFWPDRELRDGILRCEHDEVRFSVRWDPDRAASWLRDTREAGFVVKSVDVVECAQELRIACGERGAVQLQRFDPEREAFDRCSGACADGTLVRTIGLQADAKRR